MTNPQFPDPLGMREVVRPGATASKAGPDMLQRVAALEQGALGRPGPEIANGSVITSDTSQTGGVGWTARQTSHYASMYVANSGAPTNTGNGAWQKVGSGGGTATYVGEWDVYPSGVAGQVDVPGKALEIRTAGVYLITATVAFSALGDATYHGVGVWKEGAQVLQSFGVTGGSNANVVTVTAPVACSAGDTLELYAITNDSASEAYLVGSSFNNRLAFQYLGPTS